MKRNVLTFIRDMKAYNIGQYMTNGGLILVSVGAISALVGNRLRINTVDSRVIIGGEKLERFFNEIYKTVIEKES